MTYKDFLIDVLKIVKACDTTTGICVAAYLVKTGNQQQYREIWKYEKTLLQNLKKSFPNVLYVNENYCWPLNDQGKLDRIQYLEELIELQHG